MQADVHLPDRDGDSIDRNEPWPWILASLLLTMMVIACGFAWIASAYPDPVIVDERYEARADSFTPRLQDGAVPR